MIRPSAKQELACAIQTLDQQVRAAVRNTPVESTVATLGHILRHARVRLEQEGQVLFDDIAALRTLLVQVRNFLVTLDAPNANSRAIAIDTALSTEYCDEATYRSLEILAAEAGALREQVYQSLKLLQGLANPCREDADYQRLRTAISHYTAWQIEQEGKLVEPAFFSQGPRR